MEIHITIIKKCKRKNWQQYNNDRGLYHLTYINGRDHPGRNQWRNSGLNDTLEQKEFIYIYIEHFMQKKKKKKRILILFKCTWNVLQDRSHVRSRKSFNKFKKTETILSIFSNHKCMRLEINYKKENCKNPINS